MPTQISIKKTAFFLLFSSLFSIQSFSQNVAINSTGDAPDASAGLDVSFTDKGILLPRVALTSLTSASPITSPVTSLVVYNTATTGTTPNNVYPGYYFWDGSSWNRLRTEPHIKFLTSNVTNNNATANTPADVTGLSFAVSSGVTYKFKFYIVYTATTNTGSRWVLSGPTTSALHYFSEYPSSSTAKTFNNGLTGYNLPATTNTNSASTTGNTSIIEGIITPSANGTLLARFASETGGQAVVALANLSYVQWEILR